MARLKRRARFGPTIATRRLRVGTKGNQSVTVTIGLPQKSGKNWICHFKISGKKPLGGTFTSYGVDSVQALALALNDIRQVLDRTGAKFTWRGGDPGDAGFPKRIDTGYSLGFTQRMERLLEIETANHSQAIRRKKLFRSEAKPCRACEGTGLRTKATREINH